MLQTIYFLKHLSNVIIRSHNYCYLVTLFLSKIKFTSLALISNSQHNFSKFGLFSFDWVQKLKYQKMNVKLWNKGLQFLSGGDCKKLQRPFQSLGSKLSLKGRKEA